MYIHTIASGSQGNCYFVSDGATALFLEAGVPVHAVQASLLRTGHAMSEACACLVTHEHGDHAKYARQFSARGVPVCATRETLEAVYGTVNEPFGVTRLVYITPRESFRVGSWLVLAFSVVHDAANPVGYLIYSEQTREKLLFATDCATLDGYVFPGLTHVLIECNYQKALLDACERALANRIVRTHMGLSDTTAFLKRTDLSSVLEIRLIHLSQTHACRDEVTRAVAELTGKPVYAEPQEVLC